MPKQLYELKKRGTIKNKGVGTGKGVREEKTNMNYKGR